MAIIKNWFITELFVDTNNPQYPDNVFQVRYTLKIYNTGDENSMPGNMHYHVLVPLDGPSTNFTPYEQLTEAQVNNWVIEKLGNLITDYENQATAMVSNFIINKERDIPDLPRDPFPWE